MSLLSCIDCGTLKIIPADSRNTTYDLEDTTVSDIWETADFSDKVRNGTNALYLLTSMRSVSTQDQTFLCIRGYGETAGADYQTYTFALYGEGNNNSIALWAPIIVYAPNGKFDYRRLSSNHPITSLRFVVQGYFI